ncbi:hypothetical protein H4R19_006853 [Coemansia spiralis]|nr:hypothetical protein H4R19_006853 [Coemansia spiralis]
MPVSDVETNHSCVKRFRRDGSELDPPNGHTESCAENPAPSDGGKTHRYIARNCEVSVPTGRCTFRVIQDQARDGSSSSHKVVRDALCYPDDDVTTMVVRGLSGDADAVAELFVSYKLPWDAVYLVQKVHHEFVLLATPTSMQEEIYATLEALCVDIVAPRDARMDKISDIRPQTASRLANDLGDTLTNLMIKQAKARHFTLVGQIRRLTAKMGIHVKPQQFIEEEAIEHSDEEE